MAEELWRVVLGGASSVHLQAWPAFDASAVEADEVELAVQVNGKVRGKIVVAADLSQEDIIAVALIVGRRLGRGQRGQEGRGGRGQARECGRCWVSAR